MKILVYFPLRTFSSFQEGLMLISTVVRLSVAIATFCAFSATANAVSINFQDGTGSTLPDGSPTYAQLGYEFAGVPGGHFDNRPGVCPGELCWHEGFDNTAEMIVTLTFSGGSFDFLSLDITNTPVRVGGFPLLVSSSNGDSASLGPAANTYVLNWTGVDWVKFDVQGTFPQDHSVTIDNVVVTPEPSTALLVGIGLLTCAARKRHQTA